jgi:hypothetical protein
VLLRLVLVLGVAVAVMPAVEDADIERLLRLQLQRQAVEQAEAPQAGARPNPGRAVPSLASGSFACEVEWDDYMTLIVVEEGVSTRRLAWVATRHREAKELAVAYAGTAFVDERGDIHIDCRNAFLTGPMADQWSPDSFAIEPGGRVRIIDDAERGNPGRLVDRVPARKQEAGPLDAEYRRRRLLARFFVVGAL